MDVIVSRSGGIAGLRLTWRVDVDTQPDPDQWYVLIRTIPWEEPRPVPPEPDRYVYRIRCEPHEETVEEPHEATLAERQLTGPWRELVERVREVSEPQRGGPGDRPAERRAPAARRSPAERAAPGGAAPAAPAEGSD